MDKTIVISSSCNIYLFNYVLISFMKAGLYVLGQVPDKVLLGVLNMCAELASLTSSAKMVIVSVSGMSLLNSQCSLRGNIYMSNGNMIAWSHSSE